MEPLPGRHVLSLEVLWTPYSLAGGWGPSEEPRRWLEAYGGLVQPGFLDSVVDWRAMTPPDYEAEFGMRKGYAPSFPGTPIDAVLGRPRPLARYRSSHTGLYFTGAATYPGAGIWGAPGRNAAAAVVSDLARERV
jgi:phytoene dehydrogenase-like protein